MEAGVMNRNDSAPDRVWPQEPGPEPHDPASARIRNMVIDRLLLMNSRHAAYAWQQRRLQPVGPHGLAFFYCEQVAPAEPPRHVAEPPRHYVAAATRLVDDGGDVRDLPRLLYRLTTLARERYSAQAGGFDPLMHMTNRADPMSPAATYIGIGVSSLDTANARWEDAQRVASGPLDVAGRCFGLLRDGSAMLVERGAQDVFGEVRVYSTHELNVQLGLSMRRWMWKPDLTGAAGMTEIWRRLYDLHTAVTLGGARHGSGFRAP